MRRIAAVHRVVVGPVCGLSCVKHRRHSPCVVFWVELPTAREGGVVYLGLAD